MSAAAVCRKSGSVLIAGVATLALFSSACSLQTPKSSGGLKIIIDDPNKNAALAAPLLNSFSGLLSAPQILGTTPTSTADFNCFAVNVTGEGIQPDSSKLQGCTSATQWNGVGAGKVSDTTARGKSIQIDVRSGTNRTIDVYGVYPPDDNCGGGGGGGGNNGNNGNGGGYFLGRVVRDLLVADITVTVGIAYAGTGVDVVCAGGGNNGGGQQGFKVFNAFPYGGRSVGGWIANITGNGLTANTSVSIGPTLCTTKLFKTANNSIDCTMPALSPGSYDINVVDGVQTFTLAGAIQIVTGVPFVSVSQNTNFGTVDAGSTKDTNLTFQNEGATTSPSAGTPSFGAAPITIVGGSCAFPSSNLSPGSSCNATLRFSPVAAGTYSATPSFFGVPVGLNGVGSMPPFIVSAPASASF